MFVYVLTFIACLGASSDRCHSVKLPWDGSLMQCMILGQHAAAQWTSEHPGWALADAAGGARAAAARDSARAGSLAGATCAEPVRLGRLGVRVRLAAGRARLASRKLPRVGIDR